jgi:hypothetical protein
VYDRLTERFTVHFCHTFGCAAQVAPPYDGMSSQLLQLRVMDNYGVGPCASIYRRKQRRLGERP